MKKRILIITMLVILVVAVIFGVYQYIKIKEEETKQTNAEYTPQEEISEEQMRKTIVSLYFKSGNTIMPEARLMDVKKLLEDPYTQILTMLIEGPKSDKLTRTIPEGTKLNKIVKEGENLIIDFSKEFIENHVGGEEEEKLTIKSIVNTMTELTEINGIKIKIDGEENKQFKDGKVTFQKVFNREV